MNVLARADAIDLGRHVGPESAELAYLDPPFAVGARFGARTRAQEPRASGPIAYDDRWPSIDAYLAWLEPRVRAVADGALAARNDVAAPRPPRRARGEAPLRRDLPGAAPSRERSSGSRERRQGADRPRRDAPDDPRLRRRRRLRLERARPGPARAVRRDEPVDALHEEDGDGRAYRERTIRGRTYRYYADEGRALGSVWTDCPAHGRQHAAPPGDDGVPDAEAAQAARPHRPCRERARRARRRSVLRLGDDARGRRARRALASSDATSASWRSRPRRPASGVRRSRSTCARPPIPLVQRVASRHPSRAQSPPLR